MLLVIDNYDSFTYNLVQYLGELGAEPLVSRNDAITVDEIGAMARSPARPSPGPCARPRPRELRWTPSAPWGAHSRRSASVWGPGDRRGSTAGGWFGPPHAMHGKTSRIAHNEEGGIFANMPNPLESDALSFPHR